MTEIHTLWQQIEQAGNIDNYVRLQLEQKGYIVQRKKTDHMTKRELEQYKKALKTEAATTKELRRLAYQAYKQHNICYLGESVYWNDKDNWDKWDHIDADKRLITNDLPKLSSAKQLAQHLELSISELRWLAFHRNAATISHYQQFTIAKRSGGERSIWAPKPKLKVVQRSIHQQIVERLPVHGAAHGFMPGRSIVSNASVHQHNAFLVKVDLKDFFPSISWRRIKGIFRHAGYREQVATLLAMLCTESPREQVTHAGKTYYIALGERCLPQGAPTSPGLTNTLCLNLDRRVSGLATALGGEYTRYADDLTFSFPQEMEVKKLLGTLQAIVQQEGFVINHQKTRIIRPGNQQQITGMVVNDEHGPRAPRKLKRQLRAAIHNLRQGKALPEGETLQRLRGYASYVTMSEPELGRHLLTELSKVNVD